MADDYLGRIGGAINSPYLSASSALASTIVDPMVGMFSSAGDALQRANARSFDPNVPADQTFQYPAPIDTLSSRIDDSIGAANQHQGGLITAAAGERNPFDQSSKFNKLEMVLNSLRKGVR